MSPAQRAIAIAAVVGFIPQLPAARQRPRALATSSTTRIDFRPDWRGRCQVRGCMDCFDKRTRNQKAILPRSPPICPPISTSSSRLLTGPLVLRTPNRMVKLANG